jgi:hypothetical protein
LNVFAEATAVTSSGSNSTKLDWDGIVAGTVDLFGFDLTATVAWDSTEGLEGIQMLPYDKNKESKTEIIFFIVMLSLILVSEFDFHLDYNVGILSLDFVLLYQKLNCSSVALPLTVANSNLAGSGYVHLSLKKTRLEIRRI